MIESNVHNTVRGILIDELRELLKEYFKTKEKDMPWLFREVKTKVQKNHDKDGHSICISGNNFDECDHNDFLNIVAYGGSENGALAALAKTIKGYFRNKVFVHPTERPSAETIDAAIANFIDFVHRVNPNSDLLKKLKELRLENLKNTGEIGGGLKDPPPSTPFDVKVNWASVMRFCKEQGVHIQGPLIHVKANKAPPHHYWADIRDSKLLSGFFLICNDVVRHELHLFEIPPQAINCSQLYRKNSLQYSVEIQYEDPLFTDYLSKISFKKWHIKTLSYAKENIPQFFVSM